MKTDITILAEAILAEAIEYYEPDCRDPYYYCVFCEKELRGRAKNLKDLAHTPDCPVIIARKYSSKE